MSITKKLVVTLKDDVATPSEKVFIYKGDIGVDIIIELENFNYKIDSISKKNMINRIEAYFKNPQGIVKRYNDEVDIINGDRIKFSFNKKVINDMQIIGQYELQFHLFDKENNRITIPSYYFYVKEPLHNTFGEQEDNESRVDYARVDYSKVKDDIVLFEVSENGYIKTNWQSGDLITSAKLNKIEAQLEINTNKINEIQPYDDTRLNNSLNRLSESINNLNIPTKTSELENDSTYVTESGVLEIIENSGGIGGATEVSQGETEPTEESVLLWIDTTSDENMVENNLSNSLKAEIQNSISALNTRVSTLEKNIEPPFGEDAHTHSNKVVLDKITQAYFDKWNNKSDFNGSYNSLTDKPTIPTRTSELTNDTNYVTSSSIPTSLPANGGNADTVSGYTIWIGTQAEYDAISSKNSTTIYFIRG